MSVIEHYKRALGNIAGEWHARRLPDGERFGCSCPEFAREMLDTAPPDDYQGAVEEAETLRRALDFAEQRANDAEAETARLRAAITDALANPGGR